MNSTMSAHKHQNKSELLSCPECGFDFPLTDAIGESLEKELRADITSRLEADFAGQREQMQAEMKVLQDQQRAREKQFADQKAAWQTKAEQELKARDAELAARDSELAKRDAELARQNQIYAEKLKGIEAETQKKFQDELAKEQAKVSEQLAAGQKQMADQLAANEAKLAAEYAEKSAELSAKAQSEAEKKVESKMAEITAQLDGQTAKLQAAHEREMSLMQKEAELREQQQKFEREAQAKLLAEKQKAANEAREEAAAKFLVKEQDQNKLIEDMRKEIQVLQQKAEQGSMQSQGEVAELALEEILKEAFPHDEFKAIAVGKRGADILQTVKNDNGKACGRILWESKRTKNFANTWVTKLKDDMQRDNADVAVIVSTALPKDIEDFGPLDGIWVARPRFAQGLAMALRHQLILLAQSRSAIAGQSEKMTAIYRYLTGNQFAQRVQSMIDTFTDMKTELDKERRASERTFAKREKQMEKVALNVAGMIGDIQGLGAPVKDIGQLEHNQEMLPWDV